MANSQNLIGHGFDEHPERINKKGRPRKTINQLAALVKEEFDLDLAKDDKYQLCEWMLEKSIKQIKKIVADEASPAFLVSIGMAILADIKAGRTSTVEMVFDRVFGRPNQALQVEGGQPVTITEVIIEVPKVD